MFFRYNALFAFLALCVPLVKGQAPPVVVAVGLQGSFYSPGAVAAALNSTITFEFYGDVHTVTQSTFEDPCSPIPGGFHSGYFGMGLNSSAPIISWNLIVTNVSAPIWFFCATKSPAFHCSVGMVGAINPPSQDMYSQFSSAAKLVTTTASVNNVPVLTGVGAFATMTPTPLITSPPVVASPTPTPTTSSTTSTSTTSSSSPSPTNTTAPSRTSHVGAIVGGSVGGSAALIGLIILLVFCLLRKKQAPKTQSDDSFLYNPSTQAIPGPSVLFAEELQTENHYRTPPVSSNSPPPSTHLSPLRRPSDLTLLANPYIVRHEPAQSEHASSTANLNTQDIRSLAQEVAAVLSQNPPIVHSRQDSSQDSREHQQSVINFAVQNDANVNDTDATQISDHPPPSYPVATSSRPSTGHPDGRGKTAPRT